MRYKTNVLKIRVSVVRFRPWAPSPLLIAEHNYPKLAVIQHVAGTSLFMDEHCESLFRVDLGVILGVWSR